jgi:hypothetical protein
VICTTIPPCCLIARQTLRWSVCVLQVAASSWVAICGWLAKLCFSTAHFRKSNTTVGQDMQLQGLGSVCSKDSLAMLADGFPCLLLVASTLHQILVHVARFVSSLMRWQRGAHVLGKTNPTSISGLRAGCLLECSWRCFWRVLDITTQACVYIEEWRLYGLQFLHL